jgi:hypothetical protein
MGYTFEPLGLMEVSVANRNEAQWQYAFGRRDI